MDDILSRVGHEDAVTPGRTTSVHILRGFSVVLAVRVAGREMWHRS